MGYIRHEDKIIKIVDKYPISDTEEKTDMQMEIRKVYKKAHILEMTTSTFQGMPADEIYRKAKAFDAIVNIEDNYNKEKGFSPCVEEYVEEVEEIISEYMERADDERRN